MEVGQMKTQTKEGEAAPPATKQDGATTRKVRRIILHTNLSEKQALEKFPQDQNETPSMAPRLSERYGVWLQLDIKSSHSGECIWGYFPVIASIYDEEEDCFKPLDLANKPSQIIDGHLLTDVEEKDLEKLEASKNNDKISERIKYS